jgi:hypothetical protein
MSDFLSWDTDLDLDLLLEEYTEYDPSDSGSDDRRFWPCCFCVWPRKPDIVLSFLAQTGHLYCVKVDGCVAEVLVFFFLADSPISLSAMYFQHL